ncbi:hypothetical protein RXV95_09640 [Novosphingobium sp. ZN18A2]|uniref:hypothetical protein n=1 Tax=Novosphingobium sp. ZN18A2 TaxID=3079861 RepID=UPI0030D31033
MADSDRRNEGMRMACLVFESGRRPGLAAIKACSAGTGAFTVSHADDAASGWIEVLRDGLTFDLVGLSPGGPADLPSMPHRFNLPATTPDPPGEAVIIALGPHLAGSERLMPVIRTVAGLAAALSGLDGIRAVGWLPSKSLSSANWFESAITAWLDGGPFPSLALAAFYRNRIGNLCSTGLSFAGGQDFELASADPDLAADDGRLAMRLADWLVANGPAEAAKTIEFPGCGALRVEPGPGGLLSASRV